MDVPDLLALPSTIQRNGKTYIVVPPCPYCRENLRQRPDAIGRVRHDGKDRTVKPLIERIPADVIAWSCDFCRHDDGHPVAFYTRRDPYTDPLPAGKGD